MNTWLENAAWTAFRNRVSMHIGYKNCEIAGKDNVIKAEITHATDKGFMDGNEPNRLIKSVFAVNEPHTTGSMSYEFDWGWSYNKKNDTLYLCLTYYTVDAQK